MSHPIIEELTSRYTCKKFNPEKKIASQDLAVILESLRLSTSSINAQPWKFIVVESDAAKQRLHHTYADKFQFNQPHALEASHTILFAHNPKYSRDKYEQTVDKSIQDQRLSADNKDAAMGAFLFVELNTDSQGSNEEWTKAQTYIALGNAMHTVARLGIDSTPMEGIDVERVNETFAQELDGHVCHVALAIGYRDDKNDYNATLPKSRLALDDVLVTI